MISAIDSLYINIVDFIKKYETVEELRFENAEEITFAVDWLRKHQHPIGYWGYASVPDTALSLYAISTWNHTLTKWEVSIDTENQFICGFEKASNWLREQQKSNGSWEDNLWDTSVTLQAMMKLQLREEKWVKNGIEWVLSNEQANWLAHEGMARLHHSAQALNMMRCTEVDKRIVSRCKSLIIDEFKKIATQQEISNHSPYRVGQIVDALISSGCDITMPCINISADYLKKFLKESSVDNSNFLDFCLAFLGLRNLYNDSIEFRWYQNIAEKLFYSSHFRTDKSWYRDAIKTSWGLIGLRTISEFRKVNTHANHLYFGIKSECENASEELERKHDIIVKSTYKLCVLTALSVAVTGSWGTLFYLIDKNVLQNLEIYKTVIGGFGLAIITSLWSTVLIYYRKLKKHNISKRFSGHA